ncbi:MAG: UDP-N-acetylmuramoyl-tripeptide--D-alanyl-D-alanine ligase [Legionellales bacterium]|nr:UDP-N-acetylmuramoyl-tripeptide--D-alanyl-D-alanine ligase [Legionellales bacterium]
MRSGDVSSWLHLPLQGDFSFTGICIDSRRIMPGYLFVAVCGERFDGHDFIFEAVSNGAAGVLCARPIEGLSIPIWVVPDTLEALARLATEHRKGLSCKVIALTGSNGKTTVKEMIAGILPKPSYATPGNLNNHIGVPLSVLQLNAEHRFAVFELGANHVGEIAHTVAIVQPQVTLINNIAPAHIGEFGSLERIAQAKGEIHQGLSSKGCAVINDDDDFAHHWDSLLAGKKILRFSVNNPAAVSARKISYDHDGCATFTMVFPEGEMAIALQVSGPHHVNNALAAAACTYALGVSLPEIAAGLHQFRGVSGRLTFLPGKNKALVIDDTYNANLRSSMAALEVLGRRQGRRIFVFGDMGELGEWSQQYHEAVGNAARLQGIEMLMTCGTHSEATSRAYGTSGKHYQHPEDLVQDLIPQLDEHTTVLVKGSRASKMEKIVHQLLC